MPEIHIERGRYIIGAHIGFRTVLTPTTHAVQQGSPVIVAPEVIPPFPQQWIIEPASDDLPGQYYIRPGYGPQDRYLSYHDDVAFVSSGSPVAWRIQPTPHGLQILSDKGLVLRAQFIGGQVKLAQEDDSPNEAWTFHFSGPAE
ncbi:hypothetical protein [Streptomyces lasiicapitis]|uniref:hypothetical protein n=1 Tax=Streptomyces lasiicapitis TaxID=1923961 RepID=UPI00364DB96A